MISLYFLRYSFEMMCLVIWVWTSPKNPCSACGGKLGPRLPLCSIVLGCLGISQISLYFHLPLEKRPRHAFNQKEEIGDGSLISSGWESLSDNRWAETYVKRGSKACVHGGDGSRRNSPCKGRSGHPSGVGCLRTPLVTSRAGAW